jgi:hypothetical protein
MARKVARIPGGYKKLGPMNHAAPGNADAVAAALAPPAAAAEVMKTYFEQHAITPPADFNAEGLVFRVVAFQENTPQPGWGTLTVMFGYRPLRKGKAAAH